MADEQNDRAEKRDDDSEAPKEDSGSAGQDNKSGGDEKDSDDKDSDDKDSNDKGSGDKGSDDKGSDDKDSGGKEDNKPKKPPIYKRPLFWVIAIAVLLVLLIAAILFYLHKRKYESTDDAFIDAHIIRIAAQSPGRLVAVGDVDNKHVRAGQLLAVVEPSGPEAQLAEARAGVLQADAQIAQAQAQVIAARAQYRQALANARSPEAEAERARRDYERYLNLAALDRAAAAPTQIDQARAQARSTAAQADAARKQAATALAQVESARKDVDAARAQRKAAEARVQQASVTFGDLRIVAPVDGQVVNRSVNLGSYVSPGTQLMALVPDRMWVTANYKETQITLMQRGQPADIRVDAYPDITFHGHVDSIQRGAGQAFAVLPAQNATGNYVKVVQRVPVRILFDDPNPLLVKDGQGNIRRRAIGPGMSVVPTVWVRPR